MKIYETNFGIRFILLIRVKRVIIGVTGEDLGVQGEAPDHVSIVDGLDHITKLSEE